MKAEERDGRLRQIRERWAQASFPEQVFTAHVKQDIDFLLSALDNRATLARELAVIVDAGTCDDPSTALSKLHKIQHVAATRMREACVEKVETMNSDIAGYVRRSTVLAALESLTLDTEKQS